MPETPAISVVVPVNSMSRREVPIWLPAGQAVPPASRAAWGHFGTDSALPSRPAPKFVSAVLRSSVALLYAKVVYEPASGCAPARNVEGPKSGIGGGLGGRVACGGKFEVIL